jgi:hypothetical protein
MAGAGVLAGLKLRYASTSIIYTYTSLYAVCIRIRVGTFVIGERANVQGAGTHGRTASYQPRANSTFELVK